MQYHILGYGKMRISTPDFCFEKKIRGHSANGNITTGEMYGYGYDYDDDRKEFLELDVERKDGFLIGFTENEIERIEIIDG